MANGAVLTPERLEKTKEYIAQCKDENYQLIKTEGNKTTTYENKIKVKLPTLAGLANYLGVGLSTLSNLEKKYPEFAELADNIRTLQEEVLINRGLSGDYNATIDKLLLVKHGYRDGMDVVNTNVTVSKEELDRANSALNDL